MPMLRMKLQIQPENAQDFELAAESRYWEGTDLILAGRGYAGIYLLGYAAEMYLKLAALRLDGLRPGDPIKPKLAPAKAWLVHHVGPVDPEAYHSLLFWALLLRKKRAYLGRPLAPALESSLSQRVRRLYGIWWVEMRYRPALLLDHEIHSVYDDVTWLRENFFSLWS